MSSSLLNIESSTAQTSVPSIVTTESSAYKMSALSSHPVIQNAMQTGTSSGAGSFLNMLSGSPASHEDSQPHSPQASEASPVDKSPAVEPSNEDVNNNHSASQSASPIADLATSAPQSPAKQVSFNY